MKLKFYKNPKSPSDQIIINQVKHLSFRQNFVKKFGIEMGNRFYFAIDEDEKGDLKTFFLIPCDKDDLEGLKVCYQNRQFFINFGGVCNKFNLKPLVRLNYEPFEEGDYKGIKFTIDK